MRGFNRIFAAFAAALILIFVSMNLFFCSLSGSSTGRQHRVEINRVVSEIENGGLEQPDVAKYEYITNITALNTDRAADETEKFFEGGDDDYVIRVVNGKYYRIDYKARSNDYGNIIAATNIFMALASVLVIAFLIYIRVKIITPFNRISVLPYELSKGNLTADIKESKSRYFGKFIWGLNLLRENMEGQKSKELELQKEKKTLILSISHDIKTPLSAIKLYAKALIKNLYGSEEKRSEIAVKIDEKADEIGGFINEIIKASNEDFLNLEVNNSEFYLSELLQNIEKYYAEKLRLLNVDFSIEKYSNCIVKGDLDRAVEILQNIMENAVKYGDGNSISITVSHEEDCRLITVTNTGCTLKEGELPHIFDSFWRGSNTGSNAGSGLGLYICRQLVNKMDGEIFAEAEDGCMAVTVVLRQA